MVSTPQKKCTHKMRVFFVIMICRGFFLLNTRTSISHPEKKNNKNRVLWIWESARWILKANPRQLITNDDSYCRRAIFMAKLVITISSYLIFISIVLEMMKFLVKKKKFNRDKNHSINWLKHTCALNSKKLCQSMVNHKVTIVVKIICHMCFFYK